MRLAKLGARLVLAKRANVTALEELASEIRTAGGLAHVVRTDVTDESQCRRAVEATIAHFGQLDLLLCSAGISMRADFAVSDLAAMRHVMQVNFFGTFYMTHCAIPYIKQTRGSLVAISSLTGKRGVPTYAMYSASKFAVQGLYESLRVELAGDGVHVGILAPAFVDTPLRDRVLGADGKPLVAPPPSNFRLWAAGEMRRCVASVDRSPPAPGDAAVVCRTALGAG